MSDHRIDIKINAEFHGIKRKMDMDVNFSESHEVEGVDKRVIEFFQELYEKGMKVYDKIIQEQDELAHKERIVSTEQAELAKLLKKYPNFKP